ncbi:MAG: divalent metal cation transporter [Acidobacteria bacterium]|nr:MAG: divalent metal cation transporter [Acidobacteriota bacterium]
MLRVIGPGLLFAGAAVGVSHLVQSTRAGAQYGLAPLGLVLLACAMKYPAFVFGPRYAAATGRSLLWGYRARGRWAVALYAVLTLATMFAIEAAVTLVTAGLAQALIGVPVPVAWLAGAILAGSIALLVAGRYAWLDRAIKLMIALLTVSTLVATLLVVPRLPWRTLASAPAGGFSVTDVAFAAALVGWMPSAIDIAVWSSLWTLARARQTGYRPSVREATLDFDIGYAGTLALAVCFLLLGAGVMHSAGRTFAAAPGAFAAQVVELYAQTLGGWSRPLLGLAAFAVMLSTTVTVVDGFPRALAALGAVLRGRRDDEAVEGPAYWIAMAVLAVGSLLVIGPFVARLKALVDLATTLSFLTAPVLSTLNHLAVTGVEVPAADRPGQRLRRASLAGIALQAAFALGYLWLRFAPA